jgi:hypothetical protein
MHRFFPVVLPALGLWDPARHPRSLQYRLGAFRLEWVTSKVNSEGVLIRLYFFRLHSTLDANDCRH